MCSSLKSPLFLYNKLLMDTKRMNVWCNEDGNIDQGYVDRLKDLLAVELHNLFAEKALLGIMAALYGANWDIKHIAEELILDEIRRCPYVPCEEMCGKCDTCEQVLSFIKYVYYVDNWIKADFGVWYRTRIKAANRCAGLYEADKSSNVYHDQCENVVIEDVFCQHCQQSEKCYVRLHNADRYCGSVVKLAGRNAKRLSLNQLVELPN